MDGILVINKPEKMTSFDVISVLRKKYHQKKFGHTGTLDPDASGVLVVLAGRAAKLLQFLNDTDKEYEAGIRFGLRTDTGDIWGKVEEERPVSTDFSFEEVLDSLKGDLHLKVPAYSAKKVNGKKLVDLAREGKEVPEIWQDITVYDIEEIPARIPDSSDSDSQTTDRSFRVSCSSGTYVRSLCEEIGNRTGNLAVMSSLVRTKAGGFTLDQAEDLNAKQHTLYPLKSVLNYPEIHYEPVSDIYNGKHVRLDTRADRVMMMDQDEVIAIYDRHHGNVFSCARGLWS